MKKWLDMAMEKIIDEINEKAKKEAMEILDAPDGETELMKREAEKEAKRIREEGEPRIADEVEGEKNTKIALSNLQAKRREDAALLSMLEKAESDVWDSMLSLKKSKEYRDTMKSLAEKGKKEIGAKAVVFAAKDDIDLASGAKKIDCAGGIKITSSDEKIIVDYTLESIFARNREKILALAHKRLLSRKTG